MDRPTVPKMEPVREIVIMGKPFTIIGDEILGPYKHLAEEYNTKVILFYAGQEYYGYSILELESTLKELEYLCDQITVYDEFVNAYKYSSPNTDPLIINLQKMQIKALKKLNKLQSLEATKFQQKAEKLEELVQESVAQKLLTKLLLEPSKCDIVKQNAEKVTRNTSQKMEVKQKKKETFCLFCQALGHMVFKCEAFARLSIQTKLIVVKQKKLCSRCLKENHFAEKCRVKFLCDVNKCGKRHHRLLHTEEPEKAHLEKLHAQEFSS